MIEIRIAGNAPPEHTRNLCRQLSHLIRDLDDQVSLIAYTDTATWRTLELYARGEKIPALRAQENHQRTTAQLEGAQHLILINPNQHMHKIRKIRTRYTYLMERTAILFTLSEAPPQASNRPYLLRTPRRAQQTGLNQRRPRR